MEKLSKFLFNDLCNVLETYKGRDKFIRTLCYTSKLIGGIASDELFAKRCFIFSSQMSATRAVLRLFDDIPMLKYTLQYGLGKKEPDEFMASVGVLTNVVDQMYYPIDKIAWLADLKLITVKSNETWDTASSVFWVLSIYLNMLRTLRYITILQKHKKCVNGESDKSAIIKLLLTQNTELLTLIRLSLDLVHAISTLPPGFLWSSKLNPWQVGLIGTISSFLGLYQLFSKRS
ncbi:hypothetical protein RN001_006236 [Aquatica leii]|uniref:Peroxisomal membrane protein 11C n=1 Tax=Aquatica leii TaxID=1421715 RepID=A0AAN7SIG6_9COLE|nr:hypothetical protein RN001_006236 [Aquatica leii]